jgi:formylmethanofuran dehydrogenase subunit E
VRPFEELLEEAAIVHGALCAGQVLGVRLAMKACRELGIDEPRDSKRLIVFVETDRCAADAIETVTGCRLGRRTLKHVDYGKMGATFLDVTTGRAVRVAAQPDSRDKVRALFPDTDDPKEAQIAGYRSLPEDELFSIETVAVDIPPEDMPGRPVSRTACARCGEEISDRREVVEGDVVLCRACSRGPYYRALDSSDA